MKATDENKTTHYYMGGFVALAAMHDCDAEFILYDEKLKWEEIIEKAKDYSGMTAGADEDGDDSEQAIFWAEAKSALEGFMFLIGRKGNHRTCKPKCPLACCPLAR